MNLSQLLCQLLIFCNYLAIIYCYGKQLSWRVCEAISRPAPVMASKAKPSPCRIGDCFGRKERSLAMTAVLSNYDFL